jgi:hypothetical protein
VSAEEDGSFLASAEFQDLDKEAVIVAIDAFLLAQRFTIVLGLMIIRRIMGWESERVEGRDRGG